MTTIELNASQLRDLVAPVLPFACPDDMLPILTCVRIESTKGYLIATTTDRFRLGLCRRPVEVKAGLDINVRVKDLKRILTIFKPTRASDPELRLTIDKKAMSLKVEQTGGLGFLDASFTFSLEKGDFPDIKAVFEKALKGEYEVEAKPVGYNAAYLADFRHVPERNAPLVVRSFNPRQPTIVTAGDFFVGGIMPMRLVEGHGSTGIMPDVWADFLTFPDASTAEKAS